MSSYPPFSDGPRLKVTITQFSSAITRASRFLAGDTQLQRHCPMAPTRFCGCRSQSHVASNDLRPLSEFPELALSR